MSAPPYAQLDTAQVAAVAALWEADANSLRVAHLGVNAVYRFTAAGQGRYLRLTNLRRYDEWAAATDYLRHLFDRGVAVCQPLASQNGQWVESVTVGGEPLLATVVAEVPGLPMGYGHTDPQVYAVWGRSLGALHNAAATYRPAPEHRFLAWSDLWQEAHEALSPNDAVTQAERRNVERWLETLPAPTPAEFGLTHGDYRPGNVLWDGTTAWAVDFDEPVWHWYAADVARALREFSDRPLDERRRLRDWFVGGYREVRPFADRWVTDLGWFMRLKILEFGAGDTSSADDDDEPPHGPNSREVGRALVRQRIAEPVAW